MLVRLSSHWKRGKREESRWALAILTPKQRNRCSHLKRPSILLALSCQSCKSPGKASERSSPWGSGKKSLPGWVQRSRARSCFLPHLARLASFASVFDRSLRRFVVLFGSLVAIFYLLEQLDFFVSRTQFKAIDLANWHATTAVQLHACIHSGPFNTLLLEPRPKFRLSDSFVNLDSRVEVGFFSPFQSYWTCVLPFPVLLTSHIRLRCLAAADTSYKSHFPETFRSFFSQSTSAFNTQESPLTLRLLWDEKTTSTTKQNLSSTQLSSSTFFPACMISAHFRASAVDFDRGTASFFATEKGRHCSDTQTDVTCCWPWRKQQRSQVYPDHTCCIHFCPGKGFWDEFNWKVTYK